LQEGKTEEGEFEKHFRAKAKKNEQRNAKRKGDKTKPPLFPPAPPSMKLKETVIQGWCEDTSPEHFVEGGCAVCGQLTPVHQLSDLSTGYEIYSTGMGWD